MNQKQHDDLDAPTPPGGPQRTDAPAGHETPGEAAPDPGPSAPAAGSVPEPQGDRPEQDAEESDLQEENAETSLDQPST